MRGVIITVVLVDHANLLKRMHIRAPSEPHAKTDHTQIPSPQLCDHLTFTNNPSTRFSNESGVLRMRAIS
jgi:hypothetical protein